MEGNGESEYEERGRSRIKRGRNKGSGGGGGKKGDQESDRDGSLLHLIWRHTTPVSPRSGFNCALHAFCAGAVQRAADSGDNTQIRGVVWGVAQALSSCCIFPSMPGVGKVVCP